jgi:hypothetical protein
MTTLTMPKAPDRAHIDPPLAQPAAQPAARKRRRRRAPFFAWDSFFADPVAIEADYHRLARARQ